MVEGTRKHHPLKLLEREMEYHGETTVQKDWYPEDGHAFGGQVILKHEQDRTAVVYSRFQKDSVEIRTACRDLSVGEDGIFSLATLGTSYTRPILSEEASKIITSIVEELREIRAGK